MAEVNQSFEAAMRRGRELGAAGNWSKALTEYIRAAQLIPTDISARYGLAMALFKIGQLDQAQQQFQGIVRIQPQNADAWRGLAELYSQAGNTSRAVQTYEQLKDLYQRTNRNREVGEVLQQIIKIDPGNAPAYRELMDRAKARGDRKTAASLILTLGRHYQAVGELDNALSSVNEALFLIPDLPEAKSFKDELTRPPTDNFSANGAEAGEAPDPRDFTTTEMREATIQELIASAEESLNRGDTGPALRNYELAVEAGSTRSDVFYSIGKLYGDQGQTDRAVEYLRKATGDSDYAVSAYYSIGQAYAAEERFPEAEAGYWEAINHIDLQTIGRDDIDDLIDMYDELGDVLLRQNKEKEASDLYNRLVNFINSRQFRTDKTAITIIKARELNDKLQPPTTQMVSSEADGSMTSSIRFGAETAEAPAEEGQPTTDGLSSTNLPPVGTFANPDAPVRAPVVVQTIPSAFPYRLIEMDPLPAARPYLRAAEEFMKQRKYNAAVDASQELIRYFPYYLPAQAILAEIMVALDRVEQARIKYQFVVDVYQLRQDTPRSRVV
jgi:tetratricopeptide (TPR) repeat protein